MMNTDTHKEADEMKRHALDKLAAVMLGFGCSDKEWVNGLDPAVSRMLASDAGGFFDEKTYAQV